ncbi:ATP-dependent RNA helicase rhlE [Vibrio nigripulchritudo SO65]|uniref:DEAD/DEAH box helicase n=1 Tax=Vibrio nigripulchritudo TaxID=28173 RepID=UPI0003B1828C|nr:DEAD/DEAH box helicase [Vibrio nigripulchritudo]CCN34537.1 ATP-dependent RNA helicase rhlE [Vibrio nigripulchritudo AM115]CCN42159.1 ATP-dependent RNA helicase rhlE [Vibrio nigripulchritudo FTn2]CCN62704.1 ATP-dependent RNA helicase rhlE [Vibrio nigripulchritudo POn4]CCN75538.1 ATP-dependent RNA helicase rhlE [Vibrio nigripulchritudo SO65]
MSFSSLGLSPELLRAIEELGYETPSPIQAQAIPPVIQGRDVMAAAQTGTGKTAGFTLPLLQRLAGGKSAKSNHVRALVLTPTRELAAQVNGSVVKYGKYLNVNSNVVFGGVKINPQMMKLRKGSDVLVATPGRLLDLYRQNAVKFSQLEVLVLDEADRMLDMGFIRDIKKILALLPEKRQNLLFSATFSDDIRALAKGLVHNPEQISVSPPNATAKTVEQYLYNVDKKKKPSILAKLIKENDWSQVLIFSKTKHGANRLSRFLESENISAAAIHGNKSQGARIKALEHFKTGQVRALVATDIAARGLDIPQLPQVVNFELPHVPEDYVHRIGRTGRAGESGKAYSLVCADEAKELFAIERLIQKLIPRETVEGYTPVHALPESKLDTRPVKPKKPKKKKKFAPEGSANPNNADEAGKRSSKPKRKPNPRNGGAGRRGKDENGKGPNGKANAVKKDAGKKGAPSKEGGKPFNKPKRRRKPKPTNTIK